jgi:hypothetical protein
LKKYIAKLRNMKDKRLPLFEDLHHNPVANVYEADGPPPPPKKGDTITVKGVDYKALFDVEEADKLYDKPKRGVWASSHRMYRGKVSCMHATSMDGEKLFYIEYANGYPKKAWPMLQRDRLKHWKEPELEPWRKKLPTDEQFDKEQEKREKKAEKDKKAKLKKGTFTPLPTEQIFISYFYTGEEYMGWNIVGAKNKVEAKEFSRNSDACDYAKGFERFRMGRVETVKEYCKDADQTVEEFLEEYKEQLPSELGEVIGIDYGN